jgi:CubicO group peptidase (beta-lactamase class C family)
MTKKQFRVLYREFLFRIVDRELMSTYAKGDMSQLLLQISALLVFLSLMFSFPATRLLNPSAIRALNAAPAITRLMFEWSIEHFLIATTMLIVGLFAVLSWNSMFPDHRDVHVLAPLPIRAHTLLLAKLSAVGTAMSLAIAALHVVAGVIWPLAFNVPSGVRAVPAFTSDLAIPAVGAADLQAVLDNDLAGVRGSGPLAPNAAGGLAIGVYKEGVRQVFAYGRAAPDSIFEIGSITKAFTGLALAQMVEEGRVKFDQPVRELIAKAHVARPEGSEITLLDLATHHSGLPPLPWNLRPRNLDNPYGEYDVAKLYTFLERRGLAREPAPPFVYSNLGFGLLGHALGARAGVDYETLVGKAIAEPLGMTDTVVELTPAQTRRFMQGFNDRRRPVRPWDTGVFAGAGALRSTAPDMLAWLEANLRPERSGTLAAALASSHQLRALRGTEGSIALAWLVDRESGNFQHGGAVAGFTADAFFNPQEDVAAVVLSNTGPGSAVSADLVGDHVRARLAGKPAVSVTEVVIPATGSIGRWIRLLAAYWFTMLGAGVFMFGLAAGAQGLAAALFPRRIFLRVSSFLQLGAFGLIVGVYFLQPMMTTPSTLLSAQQGGALALLPSYWFLGLFQALTGSPALAPLARVAWTALAMSVSGMAIAYGLSYVRTLRRIAEEPDIAPGVARFRWLPNFGTAFPTAIVQFSLRTLFRSGQHRVLLAFYWGIAFALTAMLLKTPRGQELAESAARGWQEGSVPLLVASIWMMGFAVLATRSAFSLPRDLSANWIFRIVPIPGARQCVRARRRAMAIVSVLPVWAAAAATFLWMWPAAPAVGHLVALGLLGVTLVEISLSGVQKLPFTCSYLPGKSRVHIWIYVLCVLVVPLTFAAAELEQDALQNASSFAAMLGVLGILWMGARWRAASFANSEAALAAFEDEPTERLVTLDVWDTRFASSSAGQPTGRSLPPRI